MHLGWGRQILRISVSVNENAPTATSTTVILGLTLPVAVYVIHICILLLRKWLSFFVSIVLWLLVHAWVHNKLLHASKPIPIPTILLILILLVYRFFEAARGGAQHLWAAPTITPSNILLSILLGAIIGMIGRLPDLLLCAWHRHLVSKANLIHKILLFS